MFGLVGGRKPGSRDKGNRGKEAKTVGAAQQPQGDRRCSLGREGPTMDYSRRDPEMDDVEAASPGNLFFLDP